MEKLPPVKLLARSGIRLTLSLFILGGFNLTRPCIAGPYAPGVGQGGTTAVSANDPGLVLWASAVGDLRRGPQAAFDPETYGDASFGLSTNALGPADVTISDEDQQ